MSGSKGPLSGGSGLTPIADQRFLGNYSGASATPTAIQLVAGSGITFSGTTTSLTITASGSGGGMVLLDHSGPVTGGSSPATITFSTISQTCSHLYLLGIARCNGFGGQTGLRMRVNGDSGNNYNGEFVTGWGTDQYDATEALATSYIKVGDLPMSLADAGYFGEINLTINGYAGTARNKNVTGESMCSRNTNSTETNVGVFSGVHISTSAITSITLFPQSNNFEDGTEFWLYGL